MRALEVQIDSSFVVFVFVFGLDGLGAVRVVQIATGAFGIPFGGLTEAFG
jgi:hypothetical protein